MGDFNIINFLKSAVVTGASDEHLKVGHSPYLRLNGFIKKTNLPKLTLEDIENAIKEIIPANLKDVFNSKCDLDFMYEIEKCSRFRVNYNRQIGKPALVIRNVPYKIPTFEELNLPSILTDLTKHQSGIIFVTGPTGCGKSTTLAAMINQICQKYSKHVITIEDPIEYIFNTSKSIISQRLIGIDTETFSNGIKYALRQDPDVIFIGEIRDRETLEAALKAAETGHLVLTTLHTNDAIQTINRIVNMFEESNRLLVRKQLAETLRATIAQKLIYSEENNKRFPACEILVSTPTIKDYIIKDNAEAIYELIKENTLENMITMNASLLNLVNNNLISKEEALENSNEREELERIFRGIHQGTKAYYE